MLLGSIIQGAVDIITLPFRFIWENCKDIVTSVWNGIKNTVSSVLSAISGVISSIMGAIQKRDQFDLECDSAAKYQRWSMPSKIQ